MGRDRSDYAAYGDTANTASRLEAANKRPGTRTCVSAAVVEGMPGFQGRLVGTHVADKRAGFHLKRLLNGEKGIRIAVE